MTEAELLSEIQRRMAELAPLIAEYNKLQAADMALARVPGPAVIGKPWHDSFDRPNARRYSRGEKIAAINQARKYGVKNSSRTYGIPEATIYRWLRKGSS